MAEASGLQAQLDSGSYLSAEHNDAPHTSPPSQPKTYSEGVVIGLSVTVAVLAIALIAAAVKLNKRPHSSGAADYASLDLGSRR